VTVLLEVPFACRDSSTILSPAFTARVCVVSDIVEVLPAGIVIVIEDAVNVQAEAIRVRTPKVQV
jgi:hypothetical protein